MNKRLLILRHGKAEPGSSLMADIDRPLAIRGHEEVTRMARFLLKDQEIPERILSSNAVRTRQTTEHVIDVMGLDPSIATFHHELYCAPAAAYLDVLSALPKNINTVMLVGHNPGLSHLVAHLTEDLIELKTSTVADVRVEGTWQAFSKAHLDHLWFPKFLDADE